MNLEYGLSFYHIQGPPRGAWAHPGSVLKILAAIQSTPHATELVTKPFPFSSLPTPPAQEATPLSAERSVRKLAPASEALCFTALSFFVPNSKLSPHFPGSLSAFPRELKGRAGSALFSLLLVSCYWCQLCACQLWVNEVSFPSLQHQWFLMSSSPKCCGEFFNRDNFVANNKINPQESE